MQFHILNVGNFCRVSDRLLVWGTKPDVKSKKSCFLLLHHKMFHPHSYYWRWVHNDRNNLAPEMCDSLYLHLKSTVIQTQHCWRSIRMYNYCNSLCKPWYIMLRVWKGYTLISNSCIVGCGSALFCLCTSQSKQWKKRWSHSGSERLHGSIAAWNSSCKILHFPQGKQQYKHSLFTWNPTIISEVLTKYKLVQNVQNSYWILIQFVIRLQFIYNINRISQWNLMLPLHRRMD